MDAHLGWGGARAGLLATFIGLSCMIPAKDAFACNPEEARTNIEWVLRKDEGARRTYNNNRDQGASPYRAVIEAQAHNLRAQNSIRQCGNRAAVIVHSMLCDDAPRNIDWVLFDDRGARDSFEDGRKWGMSDLDAVLHAQRHNHMARDSIVACSPYWAAEYIADRLAGGPGMPPQLAEPPEPGGVFLCKESLSGGEPFCEPTDHSRQVLEANGFECEDQGAEVRCF